MSRFDDARAMDIAEIIKHYNINVSQNGYLKCPFCTTERTSGAIKGNRMKCFHCGFSGSTIDFVSKIEDINPIEAVNVILDNKMTVNNYSPSVDAEKCHKNDILKNMVLKNSRLLSRCPTGMQYFNDRGLCEALKLINNEQLQIRFNDYNGYKSVIYRFRKQDFLIQKSIEKNADGKRFVRNFGTVSPVALKSYDHNKYMIVEGVEDGMTAISLGFNCIVLNSVQNINKLIELMENNEDWSKSNRYFLCLDNDNAGNEGMEKITTFLSSKGLNFRDSRYRRKMIEYDIKDLNQYYTEIHKGKRGRNENREN